ncbi:hypothetical protein M9Y10_018000 [Tritrichomonas musculus]|uniref:DUF3447 domain-containing protein n=1 Tax=Tritrichomonas musculus TaxID=1915356 RepID=A0ABR2HWU1_9EUKA
MSSNYLDEMKKIQENILEFLESESNTENIFKNLKQIFNEIKIYDDQHKLKSLLHLLTKIAENHRRNPNFFNKIEQILSIFKEQIKKYFSNWEIFTIFKGNKKILLFLIEEHVINIDENIAKEITTKKKYRKSKYPQYFAPEIKYLLKANWFPRYDNLIKQINEEIPEDFYELRKIGEEDRFICKLIQKDSIKEFIVHVNQTNLPLTTSFEPSIYETNSFLAEKSQISLIEYAAFCGSIQIFNFLKTNGVQIEQSLLNYSIHGKNAGIFHFCEENIKIEDNYCSLLFCENVSCIELFEESIKCHHNDFANYLLSNYAVPEDLVLDYLIENYNFEFMQSNLINEDSFLLLCKFDYYIFAEFLLKNKNIDINTIKYLSKFTALHLAAQNDNIEIVKLLLSTPNVDVNVQSEDIIDDGKIQKGFTALHFAALNNNIEIAKLLLSTPNIDVNIQTSADGYFFERNTYFTYTALHLAVQYDNIEIVKLLLSNSNIDVNIQISHDRNMRYEGYTALHIAARNNDIEIVELLLSNPHIDVNILDFRRMKAFDVTYDCEIRKLIMQRIVDDAKNVIEALKP